jgi:hypothetical protein
MESLKGSARNLRGYILILVGSLILAFLTGPDPRTAHQEPVATSEARPYD